MNPIRRHVSCPDCGYVPPNDIGERCKISFDCPRCGAHYAHDDFWDEQEQKWQAQNHKRAQADLSGENEA